MQNSVSPEARATGRSPKARWLRSEALIAIALALPMVVAFVYFAWGPIVTGVVMSFQANDFARTGEWVGVENYTYVLGDPLLVRAIINTLIFAALIFAVGVPVPLFFAVIVGEVRKRRGLFSALAYLPVVIPPVAGILLWKTFYYPDETGLLNTLLKTLGLGPFEWLQSPVGALPSIVVFVIWSTAGGTAIIYLAALTGVRVDLYEAAELDGAGIWRRMWHVTFPQMRGIILIVLLLQIIAALQLFAEPFLFTNGGPGDATLTIMLLIYRYAFNGGGDFGAATALSVLLAVCLAVVSVVYLRATKRWSVD